MGKYFTYKLEIYERRGSCILNVFIFIYTFGLKIIRTVISSNEHSSSYNFYNKKCENMQKIINIKVSFSHKDTTPEIEYFSEVSLHILGMKSQNPLVVQYLKGRHEMYIFSQ